MFAISKRLLLSGVNWESTDMLKRIAVVEEPCATYISHSGSVHMAESCTLPVLWKLVTTRGYLTALFVTISLQSPLQHHNSHCLRSPASCIRSADRKLTPRRALLMPSSFYPQPRPHPSTHTPAPPFPTKSAQCCRRPQYPSPQYGDSPASSAGTPQYP